MQGSNALDNYDTKKAEKSLKMLFTDKSNEFRELAHGIGYPTSNSGWEHIILNFCLDFDDCFKAWSSKDLSADHMQVHKCNTMMRQIGLGKSNMTEVTHLENIAYRIAEDFKAIYKRIE
jgi:hypothetical protein